MKKYIPIPCLLIALLAINGCRLLGFYDYDMLGEKVDNKNAGISIPAGIKKKKRMIEPSLSFINAVKTYRVLHHHFPQSIWELENFSDKGRTAFRDMKALGFNELNITYVYLDSLIIGFTHAPVYNQQIGTTKLPGYEITGRLTFTFHQDSSFQYVKSLDR
jgi:hypothetical protein